MRKSLTAVLFGVQAHMANNGLSTRDAILSLLRYRPMTIAELILELGVTRTAIILPLGELEREGLVRKEAVSRTGKVGKPARRFELVPLVFEATSEGYQAVAPHILAVIGTPEASDTKAAMLEIGRRIHDAVKRDLKEPNLIGLEQAVAFLRAKGAEIELGHEDGQQLVVSHSCPIGSLVRTNPAICGSIAEFLGRSNACSARSDCIYGEKLTCRFLLSGKP